MKSQNQMILDYLQGGRSFTTLEAMSLFKCIRPGSRISDLRGVGHPIITTMVHDEATGKRYARYSMAV